MNDDVTSDLIKTKATRHVASARLESRVHAALLAADAMTNHVPVAPRRTRASWWKLGGAFAASILASVAITAYVMQTVMQEQLIAAQIFSSHTRALVSGRIYDVASSDQHTVKPWFSGKLDFSPPVADLASAGFPLAGGRVDYIDGHAVATLVYRRRLHVIDVYVWPSASLARATASARNGFNAYAWRDGGMNFWAVADVPAAELHSFVQQLRATNAEFATSAHD